MESSFRSLIVAVGCGAAVTATASFVQAADDEPGPRPEPPPAEESAAGADKGSSGEGSAEEGAAEDEASAEEGAEQAEGEGSGDAADPGAGTDPGAGNSEGEAGASQPASGSDQPSSAQSSSVQPSSVQSSSAPKTPAAAPVVAEAPPEPSASSTLTFGASTDDDPMADKAPDDEKEAKKKKGVGGFLAIADLSTSLGTGTFVLSRYTRNPYLDWTLSLMPAYEFSDRTRISVMAAVNQELTNTDAPDTPREFDLSDVRLGITRPIYTFDGPKTTIAGELYGYAPVSEISRGEGLRTAAEARLGVTQPWDDWAFSFRTAYRKNFHEYTSPVKDIDPDQVIPDCIAREGGNERVNAFTCSAGGNNVSFLINNRLSASWSVSEKVTLGASYALAHAWTYEGYDVDSECDPSEGFACPVSGVGAREGRGRRDAQDGRLFGSYSLRDNLDLTGGLVTVSSPRSEDDRRLRFPFLATEGQALNLTMIFFSVTFTEPFPIGSESSEETHAKLQSR